MMGAEERTIYRRGFTISILTCTDAIGVVYSLEV
jgi:hypothetical protein